ncbi:MAG: ATP-dependent DNA helicase RecQ [Niabella sp.]
MNLPLADTLKAYFGYDGFRPLQREVMEAALAGKDVLALMPTGGGKSLCYQVPALMVDGLCLVISPLIALMNDQVQNLRKKNITAFAIHTGMNRKEVINVLEAAAHSNCRFLYVSPERLETQLFNEYLPGLHINLIAVDEAHCISQWGYDFRPPYLRLSRLREALPGIPVMALTASATPVVQQDICEKLSPEGENHFEVFRQSFERPNLSYSVFLAHNRVQKISEILNNVPGSAIIYCKTRRRTREIAELLHLQGFSTNFYHAGLSAEERSLRQQQWVQDKTRVIVCTNAFGMGIDKPNVRTVVHADVPDCLENYYQEAGRAGRDGEKAYAVLLYDEEALKTLQALPDVRYPDFETIQKVYHAAVNYLQLPENAPPGEYHDFDLNKFITNFGLDITTTIYSLKALEQDGWLSFNEQVFIPSMVRFTAYKDELYQYEKQYVEYEPLIKALLRNYEGIYNYEVAISESYLAYLLRYEQATVREQLQRLHFDRIIDYRPQKDTPQLVLNRRRIKTGELTINQEAYAERRRVFEQRIKKMIAYVEESATCRSKFIGQYFGDENIKDCGICDNCLKRKETPLTKTLFDQITTFIRDNAQEPIHTNILLQKQRPGSREHFWTVIKFLTEEGRIILLDDGRIQWKR